MRPPLLQQRKGRPHSCELSSDGNDGFGYRLYPSCGPPRNERIFDFVRIFAGHYFSLCALSSNKSYILPSFIHSFITSLKGSVYNFGLFILGPFLLLSEKFTDSDGWGYRNRFLYHIYRSIIAAIFTALVILGMKVVSTAYYFQPA